MPANMLSMEKGQDKTLVNDQLWKKISNIAICYIHFDKTYICIPEWIILVLIYKNKHEKTLHNACYVL